MGYKDKSIQLNTCNIFGIKIMFKLFLSWNEFIVFDTQLNSVIEILIEGIRANHALSTIYTWFRGLRA